jgi:hypothetical protein
MRESNTHIATYIKAFSFGASKFLVNLHKIELLELLEQQFVLLFLLKLGVKKSGCILCAGNSLPPYNPFSN